MAANIAETTTLRPGRPSSEGTAYAVIGAISFAHAINDLIQSLVPALYPVFKARYGLDFGQVGLIQLVFMLTASLLQPVVGMVTDRRAMPFSLPAGMVMTLVGLLALAVAPNYASVIGAAACIGIGSAIFHPEASRVARLSSGGLHGTAQSLFQVGGNAGSAIGPLLAALLVVPRGQGSVAWFGVVACLGIAILYRVGRWYRMRLAAAASRPKGATPRADLSRARTITSIVLLVTLVFSKQFYLASFNSYYTFYLIHHFGLGVQAAQLGLFVFLGAVAAGTILGGPLGDRYGRKFVIWGSILGVLPFTLLLPYADLFWTIVLTIPIGLILSSALPQIIVYAQELLPGRVGLVSGLFLGFAFGVGGVGAAVLGEVADRTSIEFVYDLCAYLPAIGLVAMFLPDLRRARRAAG